MRLAALVAFALLLAGCSDDFDPVDGETDGAQVPAGPALTAKSFSLRLQSVPEDHLYTGEQFQVSVAVTGGVDYTTPHLDIHVWRASGADPKQDQGTPCSQRAADLPGTYTVSCSVPAQSGQHYIRAHAQGTHDGQKYNWWSPEEEITVH